MTKKHVNKITPIHKALNQSADNKLKQLVLQAHAKHDLLETVKWLLPAEIQPYCLNISHKNQTLTVGISEASLLTRLYFYQKEILREIQKMSALSHFTDLKFRVAPRTQSPHEKPKEPTYPKGRFFPQETLDLLSHWQASLTDNPKLNEALKKLLQRHQK